jgi:hypothetical protein
LSDYFCKIGDADEIFELIARGHPLRAQAEEGSQIPSRKDFKTLVLNLTHAHTHTRLFLAGKKLGGILVNKRG